MGACGSTKEDLPDETERERKVPAKNPEPTPKSTVEAKPQAVEQQPAENKTVEETDDDFKETLRGTIVAILLRLSKALEYEKEGYLPIATKRGLRSHVELLCPGNWIPVFEKFFTMGTIKEPTTDDIASSAYQKFVNVLEAVADAEWVNPHPSKEELASAIQKAAESTQKELKATAELADASDLKMHLFFFDSCLNVVKGDISHIKGLLYQNIDTLVANGILKA